MKWFKHLVNSTSDPDLMEAELLFKANGTYVFWRTLEILAREDALEEPLVMNFKVFSSWFPAISTKTLLKVLTFFGDRSRITHSLFDSTITIYCNKLSTISSEYTNKVRRVSGGCPESVRKMSVQIKEVDIDIDKEIEYIYTLYPSRDENCKNRSTGKCKKDKEKIKKIISRIGFDNLKKITEDYVSDCKEQSAFIKNFSTFLNQLPDTPAKPKQEPYKGQTWRPS